MTALFKTKVCGITSVADAKMCCAAGVDAIGLNFYDESPRCITVSQAVEIVAAVGNDIQIVGLFVNHAVENVRAIQRELGLQYIQLHGDEDPGYLRQLKDLPLIKAFRCRENQTVEIVDFLAACTTLDITLQAILLDAFQPGCYGGSGKRLDWETLKTRNHSFGGIDGYWLVEWMRTMLLQRSPWRVQRQSTLPAVLRLHREQRMPNWCSDLLQVP